MNIPDQVAAAERAVAAHGHEVAISNHDRLMALFVDLRHWCEKHGVDHSAASANAYDLYEMQTGRRAGNCLTSRVPKKEQAWAMPEPEENDLDGEF